MNKAEEGIEVNAEGEVVIRNQEQIDMLNQLQTLRAACVSAIELAKLERIENESLAIEENRADWDDLDCTRTERYIDSNGELGWRAEVAGADPSCVRLQAHLTDQLRDMGWDNVKVSTTW